MPRWRKEEGWIMFHHTQLLCRHERPRRNSAPVRLCEIVLFASLVVISQNVVLAQEPNPAEAPAASPAELKPAATPTSPSTQPSEKSGTAAPSAEPKPTTNAAGDDLSVEQARLADRYKRLEQVVGRLAEASASSDPRRAKLLREAIAQSREEDVNVRFESVVKLLQDERLSAAATNQSELQKELDSLLSLLLKADRDNELNL